MRFFNASQDYGATSFHREPGERVWDIRHTGRRYVVVSIEAEHADPSAVYFESEADANRGCADANAWLDDVERWDREDALLWA